MITLALLLFALANPHSATLQWQGPTLDLSGNPITYQIYHHWGSACYVAGTKFQLKATVNGVTAWTDTTNLTSGTTHCYYVVNPVLPPPSNTVTVIIP
jgi:hypothetical protein